MIWLDLWFVKCQKLKVKTSHFDLISCSFFIILHNKSHVKDARSVSWYFIIGHKFCRKISILNEFTLQKGIAKKYCFLDKKLKTTTTKQKGNIKILAWPEIEPRTSRTAVWTVTSRPPSQMKLHQIKSCYLFQRNGSKHKQTNPDLPATLF